MNYLIIYDVITPGSFIHSQLNVQRYSELKIGRHLYTDLIVDMLPCFDKYTIIFTDKSVNTDNDSFEALASEYLSMGSNVSGTIFFYDANFFPKDGALLNRIFLKSITYHGDVNYCMYVPQQGKTQITLFKRTKSDITH